MSATAESFSLWLADHGRAENTVAAYRRDVTGYLRWLTQRGGDVGAVDAATLSEYLDHLGATQRSSSVARALAAIRVFHRWCSIEGWRADDPTAAVDAPAIHAAPGRAVLGEPDVRRVVDAIVGGGLEARRDRALLLVLFRAGLKATEAIALDVADVEFGALHVHVDRRGTHPRTVPVAADAAAALAEWLDPMGRGRLASSSDALFLNQRGRRLTRQGLWLVCRTAGERAYLDHNLAPKDLRQACASGLAARGVDPEAISALLGHGHGAPPTLAELAERGWGAE